MRKSLTDLIDLMNRRPDDQTKQSLTDQINLMKRSRVVHPERNLTA